MSKKRPQKTRTYQNLATPTVEITEVEDKVNDHIIHYANQLPSCPICHSNNVRRVVRPINFRCVDCGKRFVATTPQIEPSTVLTR